MKIKREKVDNKFFIINFFYYLCVCIWVIYSNKNQITMAKKTLEGNIDNKLAMKIASLVWNDFIAGPINKGTPPPETFSFNNLKNAIAKIVIEDETDKMVNEILDGGLQDIPTFNKKYRDNFKINLQDLSLVEDPLSIK